MQGGARTTAAAIACITISGFSVSLSLPLLTLLMEARGLSDTLIGLNTGIAGLAAVIAAPATAALAGRFGTVRVLVAALLVSGVCLMAFPFTATWVWFPLRFAFGAAITLTFVTSEYWINETAGEARRGFIMGLYASVLSAGFALGPAVLGFTGSDGLRPFLIGTAMYALALVPVWMARRTVPPVQGSGSARYASLLLIAPGATLAALVFGAAEQTSYAFFALFGLRSGLGETQATLLLTMVALGNLLLQIPLGLAADRYDRRRLLLFCALVGVAGMIALPFVIHMPKAAYVLLVVWGGVTGGLYTIGLTQLGARFRGADLARANALFVMLYSLGMMLGPLGAGVAMERVGTNALAWFLAAVFAAYSVVALMRVAKRRQT